MIRKIAIVAASVLAVWCVALRVLDEVLADRQAQVTQDRLAESLQATATIGSADLALIGGGLALHGLALHRDDVIGHLSLEVDSVDCDLPPLGWSLVDRSCRSLAVRGTRLEVSTAALFHLRPPKRAPVRARRVVIDDAQLAFAPSAFVPSLGRIAVAIEHGEAGATVFRTPLSWLFAVEQLTARFDLPAGIAVRLEVHGHKLSVATPLLGAAPVELALDLPAASSAHDAREEIELLVKTGEDIAGRLVAKRAQDWLESTLRR